VSLAKRLEGKADVRRYMTVRLVCYFSENGTLLYRRVYLQFTSHGLIMLYHC